MPKPTLLPFYQGLGYKAEGEEFKEADIPHYLMRKKNPTLATNRNHRIRGELPWKPSLLVVQLMLAIALIVVILFQRTAQDGGGLVGGGSTMGGLFTARGSANLLTRTTAVLATLFILNSLTLGYIASSQHQSRSLVDQIAPKSPARRRNGRTRSADRPNAKTTPAVLVYGRTCRRLPRRQRRQSCCLSKSAETACPSPHPAKSAAGPITKVNTASEDR